MTKKLESKIRQKIEKITKTPIEPESLEVNVLGQTIKFKTKTKEGMAEQFKIPIPRRFAEIVGLKVLKDKKTGKNATNFKAKFILDKKDTETTTIYTLKVVLEKNGV